MRLTSLEQLQEGMLLYVVHAFPESYIMDSWVQEFILGEFPITTNHGSKNFCELTTTEAPLWQIRFQKWVRRELLSEPHTSRHSLQDMGVIENTYNYHQTYDNLREALQYLTTVTNIQFPSEFITPKYEFDYDNAMKLLGD